MKKLTDKLKLGIPATWLHLIRRRPEQAIALMNAMDADVKLGGEKLEEGYGIVRRLLSDDITFGDIDRAHVWLKENENL